MFGRLVAGLVVVGLAVGVWVLWPRDTDTGTTSIPEAISSTSTSVVDSTSTTASETTTSTGDGVEVIETIADAEEVLRRLWFGWFEGIYNQDEERIKEVVASQSQLDAARAAFGAAFTAPPSEGGIVLTETAILKSDKDCLVTYAAIDISAFRGSGASSSSVEVMRSVDGAWRFVSSWANPGDLWEQDCESQLEPVS